MYVPCTVLYTVRIYISQHNKTGMYVDQTRQYHYLLSTTYLSRQYLYLVPVIYLPSTMYILTCTVRVLVPTNLVHKQTTDCRSERKTQERIQLPVYLLSRLRRLPGTTKFTKKLLFLHISTTYATLDIHRLHFFTDAMHQGIEDAIPVQVYRTMPLTSTKYRTVHTHSDATYGLYLLCCLRRTTRYVSSYWIS